MSRLLPPSTRNAYAGSRPSVFFLGLLGVLTIGPGLIHSFLPDGGAESIAGLQLGDERETVIGLFAWAGATQIAWGLAMLAVAVRYPTLTPLFLLLVLLERSLLVTRWWVLSPPADHHPPEHYTSLVVLPLLALFIVLAVRDRRSVAARPERGPYNVA